MDDKKQIVIDDFLFKCLINDLHRLEARYDIMRTEMVLSLDCNYDRVKAEMKTLRGEIKVLRSTIYMIAEDNNIDNYDDLDS